MKQITDLTLKHIISEPGDATRYDYLMVPGMEVYRFFPYGSTFRYPTEIGVWMGEDDINWLAEKYSCNPCTVAECIRSMKESLNATS